MSAVMGGQGAGGVFASLVDILAKLFMGESLANAACLYFVIAVVFMVISGKGHCEGKIVFLRGINVFLKDSVIIICKRLIPIKNSLSKMKMETQMKKLN